MTRNVILWLLTILLPFVLFAGTTGKISGIVTDKETGEPLPGVNIVVTGGGLNTGAATNITGYYSIINVPVGDYEMKVSYMGKKTIVIKNLHVSLDLTTEINLEMENSTLDMEEVLVTAERKIIRKDETNTNVIKTAEDIENLPVRGMQEIAAATAGVVKTANSNNMNVRGGRAAETAVYIDGVLVNDPYNSAVRLYLPNEAIEEMSVQTGGFNAEYGDAMSGIVALTTNVGTKEYKASISFDTDQFLSAEEKFLGTYSYGHNEYVATLSGPIIPGKNHTFFFSGTRQYQADWTPSYGWSENPYRLEEMDYHQTFMYDNEFDSIRIAYNDEMEKMDTTLITYTERDTLDLGNHQYKFNARIPGNFNSVWSWNGKFKLQLTEGISLKTGFARTDREFAADPYYDDAMHRQYFFNQDHGPVQSNQTTSLNTTLTHTVSNNTFYDLRFKYFDTERKWYDKEFGDDLEKYGSVEDQPFPDQNIFYVGSEELRSLYEERYDRGTSTFKGTRFNGSLEPDFFAPGVPYDDYFKNRTTYWGIDFDLTHQLGKHHTFKTGFEYKYHTMREFRMVSPYNYVGDYDTDIERYQGADLRFYGYDVEGKEVDDGPNFLDDVERDESGQPTSGYDKQEPYHPIIMSGYLQDKIEYENIIINMGLRYDRIDPNAWMFKQIDKQVDADGNYINGTGMFGGNEQFDAVDTKPSEVYDYLSPRLGVSFPITESTVFHTQYGIFYQAPQLMDLYLSPFYLDTYVSGGGYFTVIDNPNLRPPKTTSYELGFKQMLGNRASLQLTTFFKETEDLVLIFPHLTDATEIAFTDNGDFGTIKGFDVIFTMRRFNNLSLNMNYEFQVARGTGSSTNSNFDIAWQDGSRDGNFPKFAMPLDFEQRHRGSIIMDYRYGQDDAPIGFLNNAGINMMFTFNSGNPYTLAVVANTNPFGGRNDNDGISEKPFSAVGAERTPWMYQTDLKVDKRMTFGKIKLTAYCTILNVFNKENVKNVYITTGSPNDTGYLGTNPGKVYWNSLTEDQQKQFKMREWDYSHYAAPRQIRLGLRLEL
ncbi:MAG: TonB-dependent receptor [Candidatus Marinimicrobia bacterium]|nr:TonB-dependent receptor [Candidatus Neomarinimicrobiota bacterium]